MQILSVGEPYDPSIQGWPEGCTYNYDSSGHWLFYLFNNPSSAEIASIQRGLAQFGLYVEHPVLFLLHQFGHMPWNDAPYSWWLVSEEQRRVPEVVDSGHALLKVVLVDTSTGLVAALRALTLSPSFTCRIHQEICRQVERFWSLSEHNAVIQSVYKRFATDDLVQRAEILCKGGD